MAMKAGYFQGFLAPNCVYSRATRRRRRRPVWLLHLPHNMCPRSTSRQHHLFIHPTNPKRTKNHEQKIKNSHFNTYERELIPPPWLIVDCEEAPKLMFIRIQVRRDDESERGTKPLSRRRLQFVHSLYDHQHLFSHYIRTYTLHTPGCSLQKTSSSIRTALLIETAQCYAHNNY